MAKALAEEIRLGAIYVWATKHKAHRAMVEAKMVERCGLNPKLATQLAGHWFSTEPLRNAKAGA